MPEILPLPVGLVVEAVRLALAEDLGRAGDITSLATIPADRTASAVIAARRSGVVAGMPFAAEAFRQIDPTVAFMVERDDGVRLEPGAVLARIEGPARAILTAERVALNYLGRLSGIASATADFVAAVAGTGARITDTRKTTPGLRAIEKYAVRCGGGSNHRFGLDDAVLIKDNHIAVAGGVAVAIRRARAAVGHLVMVEVEVDTLAQLAEALAAGPDAVLLDNMSPATLRKAVALIAGRCIAEASGGVTLATVRAIAETGVDVVSSGWITHSAPSLDLGLDMV
ncbi:MAG: carboxylating nicotinate-nucleotide diphosphorylase [Bauldia sp.]